MTKHDKFVFELKGRSTKPGLDVIYWHGHWCRYRNQWEFSVSASRLRSQAMDRANCGTVEHQTGIWVHITLGVNEGYDDEMPDGQAVIHLSLRSHGRQIHWSQWTDQELLKLKAHHDQAGKQGVMGLPNKPRQRRWQQNQRVLRKMVPAIHDEFVVPGLREYVAHLEELLVLFGRDRPSPRPPEPRTVIAASSVGEGDDVP